MITEALDPLEVQEFLTLIQQHRNSFTEHRAFCPQFFKSYLTVNHEDEPSAELTQPKLSTQAKKNVYNFLMRISTALDNRLISPLSIYARAQLLQCLSEFNLTMASDMVYEYLCRLLDAIGVGDISQQDRRWVKSILSCLTPRIGEAVAAMAADNKYFELICRLLVYAERNNKKGVMQSADNTPSFASFIRQSALKQITPTFFQSILPHQQSSLIRLLFQLASNSEEIKHVHGQGVSGRVDFLYKIFSN